MRYRTTFLIVQTFNSLHFAYYHYILAISVNLMSPVYFRDVTGMNKQIWKSISAPLHTQLLINHKQHIDIYA